MISTFTVLFDANIFFGAALRSLVVELSTTGLFRARWTNDIHAEWIEAVVAKRPGIDPERLIRVASLMDRAVPGCVVTGHQGLIDALNLPDPNDRHVLAAAIVGRAECIVTFNENDFPPECLEPYGIHTCHPDRFLMQADGLDDGVLIDVARADRAHYRNPQLSVDEYVAQLRRAGLPETSAYLLRTRVLLET